jgi:hypothetical protein
MSKRREQDRSRRAFLTRAGGGLAAALVAAPRAEGAQSPSRSASQPRDRGLWVTWYDLPEAGRSEHLAWLHETYIPALLKRPGYLWAAHYASIVMDTPATRRHTDDPAVPTGNAYILVVGAEDGNVFGKPAPSELLVALPEAGKRMIAMRIGERTNIFVEATRVTGPGAREYKGGMMLAPCIQLGSYNIDYQKEVDILAWYAQLQLPAMAALPGCIRTRRLASLSGWAKMGILYEFGSVDLRSKYFKGGGGPHKWTSAVQQLVHAPGSPNVARRIWPRVET